RPQDPPHLHRLDVRREPRPQCRGARRLRRLAEELQAIVRRPCPRDELIGMHDISHRLQRALALLVVGAGASLASIAGAAAADKVCTVLADAATGAVLKQEGECDRRVPPASTFKVTI